MMDFSKLNVVVIGDVMLDEYIYGSVNRISPEAPVPILLQSHREHKLGGAANVAANIVSLGATSTLIGLVGDDFEAELLGRLCTDASITPMLITDADRPTTLKTRLVARQQQVLRVDKEDKSTIGDTISGKLIQKVEQIITSSKVDVVILQDYNKGLFSRENLETIIKICNNNGVKTAVDPKFEYFDAYKGATLFKPNLKEALHLLGIRKTDFYRDKQKYCQALIDRLDLSEVWITLSADGISGLNSDGDFVEMPTQARDVIDVCGAGDAVISILSMLQCQDYSMTDKANFANRVGAVVCSKFGVVNVGIDEIR